MGSMAAKTSKGSENHSRLLFLFCGLGVASNRANGNKLEKWKYEENCDAWEPVWCVDC